MSFKNNDPELVREMGRERLPDDIDLVMLSTAKVAQIAPALAGAWCSMSEITQAVGKPPMAQRFLIFKAASTLLMALEQTYEVNTITERAALNDSVNTHDFYINTILVAVLTLIQKTYTTKTPKA